MRRDHTRVVLHIPSVLFLPNVVVIIGAVTTVGFSHDQTEWRDEHAERLESVDGPIRARGAQAAARILDDVSQYARGQGVAASGRTPYRNTIPAAQTVPYPGEKLRSHFAVDADGILAAAMRVAGPAASEEAAVPAITAASEQTRRPNHGLVA